MSLLECPKEEGVQRCRSAVLGEHCELVVAANDHTGQHWDHICLLVDVSSTVEAVPIDRFGLPHSGIQTVRSKTRKLVCVDCDRIAVG